VADPWWGRKVARLPASGTLLVATDLQGNLADYLRLETIHERERVAGHEPVLALCGDLVHGPGDDFGQPSRWPDYLGTFYRDESVELVRRYRAFASERRTLCLLGNHEHAHVGGPVVSKFHDDEAAVLEKRLGDAVADVRAFFRSFPLIATAPCGAVLTHGAPRATEPSLDAFERLDYAGYERVSIHDMHEQGTVGALLWSRAATREQARRLLAATGQDGRANAFCAFGHDVVREGFEIIGDEQICVSTSFGCFDRDKVYLRLDLSRRYASVHDLAVGREILPLWG
jgi:hypothetical protein